MNAKEFAKSAHESIDQKRDDGSPYYLHPWRVGDFFATNFSRDTLSNYTDIVNAAYLHDVLEDTKASFKGLVDIYGPSVAFMVFELTNQFTREKYPNMSREQRKVFENWRLKGILEDSLFIKLADIYDNLNDNKQWNDSLLREKEYFLDSVENRVKHTIMVDLFEAIKVRIAYLKLPKEYKF